MTERWQRYIEDGLETAGSRIAAAYESWGYMSPVLRHIRQVVPPKGSIMELGCGAGLHAALLASWGYRVTAVDNDPRIVELAAETALVFDQPVDVVQGDALDPPTSWSGYDLVFSLGLIEHFDRHVTIEMLRRQGGIAHRVLAVIPTRHTVHAATLTDERIYRPSGLRDLFRHAGLSVESEQVFGDVPTWSGRAARLLLPPPAYRVVQRRTGLAMNLCVVGRT